MSVGVGSKTGAVARTDGHHLSDPAMPMTPHTSLEHAAYHLNEAVEGLTFDRFDWALEETWHGLAWTLDALAPEPAAALPLPAKGHIPPAGLLSALLDRLAATERARCAPLVERVEALLAELDAAPAMVEAIDAAAAPISALAFDACALFDRCAELFDFVELEPVVPTASPTARLARAPEASVASAAVVRPMAARARGAITRRDALELLAAGGAMAVAACTGATPSPPASAATDPATEPATAETAAAPSTPPATIRRQTPLEGLNWPTSDPFLFCAHHVDHYPAGNGQMGPSVPLAGRVLGRDFDGIDGWNMYHGQQVPGFPRHPHRGFETITVVRTGMLDHADSMGATARYGGGDVQWLTAGGGIQHAEMFPLLRDDADNPLELFQIWLNLPASDKMVPAHFTMLWNERIPRVVAQDDAGRVTELTLVAGAYGEHAPPSPPPNSWASRPESDLAIWRLRLEPGARFTLPAVAAGTERSLYVHVGEGMRVGDAEVANQTRVELEGPGPIALEASAAEVEVLLLQARPIGEPIARRGPFVMNTPDEIRQAYADYRQTGFGGWLWSADDPVHAPARGRFALRPDGSIEEPEPA